MTDSVLEVLVQRGWQGPSSERDTSDQHYVWAARSMFPHRPICDCNDRQASLCVAHHYFTLNGHTHDSYTVEMRFEKNDRWYDLKAYSLKDLADVDAAIEPIIAAGNALAASSLPQPKENHAI